MAAIKYWNGSAWVYASIGAPGADGTDFAATLTTDGDLLTRSGGIATRLTRANLAADSAFANVYAPKASPTFTGNVVVPDANADGEALAYDQDGWKLGGAINNYIENDSATSTVGAGFTIRNTIPALDKKGVRLWVRADGSFRIGRALDSDGRAATGGEFILDVDSSVSFVNASKVIVPAATAATHAAQVSAIDAATGRLAIGGHELGSTGWRTVLSWSSSTQDVNDQMGVIDTTQYTLGGIVFVQVRRIGRLVEWKIQAPSQTDSPGNLKKINSGAHPLIESTTAIPSGFRVAVGGNNAGRRAYVPLGTTKPGTMWGNGSVNNPGLFQFTTSETNVELRNTVWSYTTDDAWPTTLPGVAA